jgi:hypothetical protein
MRFLVRGAYGFLFSIVSALLVLSPLLYAEDPGEQKYLTDEVPAPSGAKPLLKYIGEPAPLWRDDVTLRFGLHSRYKFAYLDDFNFDSIAHEDAYVNLLRFYPNLKLTFGPDITVFAEMISAESFSNSAIYRSSGFVDYVDLNQLYAEIRSPVKEVPLSVKVGRQSLSYGDERLIGAYNISNVMQVFDAVKLVFEPTDKIKVDAWFSQPVVKRRSLPDTADNSRDFYGIYATVKPVRDHVLDTFLLILRDSDQDLAGEKPGRSGPMTEYTAGNRFKGKWSDLDYGLEWAAQFGSKAHDQIAAWLWHNEVGYTLSKVSWKPRASFAFDHGSGDNNTSDGRYKNFDALFPSDDLYGDTDLVGIRNQNHFQFRAEVRPTDKLFFYVTEHFYFLDSNKSALYNADQGVVRDPTSGASRTVGKETDLLLTFKFNRYLDACMGYAFFYAGPFIKDTGPNDNANFFYTAVHLNV